MQLSDNNTITFAKMNALGNKITILDLSDFLAKDLTIENNKIVSLCQNKATEFEQLMVIFKAEPNDDNIEYQIIIYNNDGSLAGNCGNGMRAVTLFIAKEFSIQRFKVITKAGLLNCSYNNDHDITVTMGYPSFSAENIGLNLANIDESKIKRYKNLYQLSLDEDLPLANLVSIGNPHAVFFLDKMLDFEDIKVKGETLEHHEVFLDRCNISFAVIKSPNVIELRTWERGAGITQACGSASCAAHVIARNLGLVDINTDIELLGGKLSIKWDIDQQISMSGAACLEHLGYIYLRDILETTNA